MGDGLRDDATSRVVVNPEGQYSLWPAHREPPLGWADAGKVGPREECLAFISEAWTDMRPASLRARRPGRSAS